jgi:hypothetical protein
METGHQVEVRTHFDGRWVGGFDVEEVSAGVSPVEEVWVRRHSDGVRLPVPFPLADVREPMAGAVVGGVVGGVVVAGAAVASMMDSTTMGPTPGRPSDRRK